MAWFHHMLIHFSAAVSVLGAGAALFALLRSNAEVRRLARLFAYIAAMGALLSAATGLLSASHYVSDGGNPTALQGHRNVALLATALLVTSAVVRWFIRHSTSRGHHVLLTISTVLAAATAATAAHLGGAMLHEGLGPPWLGEESAHHHHHECSSGPGSPMGNSRLELRVWHH